MIFHVDPLAREPIFEQLCFQVKSAVARGELAPGDRLPSVRALAKEVAVNPNTVNKAYDALENQGVIVRRHGAGCFISPKGTVLRDDERETRLRKLISKAVTEAFHLGFGAGEVRRAVDAEIRELDFRKGGRKR